jgi:hypothetical protein
LWLYEKISKEYEKSSNKKLFILLLLIALAAFVLFFYPKHCGSWASSAENMGYTYPDCFCIGIQTDAGAIGGGDIVCWGIVIANTCYENRADNSSGIWISYRYHKPCE